MALGSWLPAEVTLDQMSDKPKYSEEYLKNMGRNTRNTYQMLKVEEFLLRNYALKNKII